MKLRSNYGNISNSALITDKSREGRRLIGDRNYMANTDTDATTGAVMADDTTADSVVSNYMQYYTLLIKYEQDSLSSADSAQVAALANECPFVDGTVIYQARTLYRQLFNDGRTFSDVGCEVVTGDGGSGERHMAATDTTDTAQRLSNQQYTLSPNPSNGNITLKQLVPDANPVMADVWNEAGISVYQGQLDFEAGAAALQMAGQAPGLYLLQLVDSAGNSFTIKFVIER